MTKSATAANGDTTTYTYSGPQLTETVRTNTTGTVTTKESFQYTYLTSGANVGTVSNILFRRKAYDTSLGQSDGSVGYTNVRQVAYAYYTDGDSGGNTGDIKTGSAARPPAGSASRRITSSSS